MKLTLMLGLVCRDSASAVFPTTTSMNCNGAGVLELSYARQRSAALPSRHRRNIVLSLIFKGRTAGVNRPHERKLEELDRSYVLE